MVGQHNCWQRISSPSALSCICPAFTSSDFYDGWTYEGGALNLAFVVVWAINLALDTARRKGDEKLLRELSEAYTGMNIFQQQAFLPLLEQPLFRDSGILSYYFDWLAHSSNDNYWKQIAIAPRHHLIKTAGLHIGGWYDIFLNGTLNNYCGLQDHGGLNAQMKQRLIIGPWMHLPWSPFVGDVDFGPGASSCIIDENQIRFYNWALKRPR